jgi:hypothetical protein
MTTVAADSPSKTRKRMNRPLLLLGSLTALAAALYFSFAAITVTPAGDANAATTNSSAASHDGMASPPAGLLPPIAPLPVELTDRLDALQGSLRDVSASLTASITHQDAMQADISAIKATLEKQQIATEAVAAERAKRAATVKRKPPLAQQQSEVAPVVLSVDMWNGKPSAVLRGLDGRIRYASAGDRIPFGAIGAIQAADQTVVIKYDDGSVATLAARQTR